MMEMIRENVKVVLRNKNGVPTISFHKKEEDRWKKRDTTLKLKNVPNNLPTEKKKKVLSFILNKLYYDIAFNVPLKNHCNTLSWFDLSWIEVEKKSEFIPTYTSANEIKDELIKHTKKIYDKCSLILER